MAITPSEAFNALDTYYRASIVDHAEKFIDSMLKDREWVRANLRVAATGRYIKISARGFLTQDDHKELERRYIDKGWSKFEVSASPKYQDLKQCFWSATLFETRPAQGY